MDISGLNVTTPMDEMRVVLGPGFPEPEQDPARQVMGHLLAFERRAGELRQSGRYTEAGVAAQLEHEPVRAAAVKALDAYHAATRQREQELVTAREAIEHGRRVRGADGFFRDVPQTAADAAQEVRHVEIRAAFRAMDASARNQAAMRAFADDDMETLRAIESAPRSAPVVDPLTLQSIRARRFERSGWADEFEAGMARVAARQRFAGKARKALGLDGGF